MENYFARLNGEIIYDERARVNNTYINTIITFQNKEKNVRHFGKVDKIISNGRGVKITTLHFDGKGFIPINFDIPGTSKNKPYFTRDIRIVRNVI
jgi:hypothetical protein